MMLLEIISGRGNSEEDCTSDRGQATYFHMQVASFLRVMSNSLVDRELVGDVNLVEVPIKKKKIGGSGKSSQTCLLVHSGQRVRTTNYERSGPDS